MHEVCNDTGNSVEFIPESDLKSKPFGELDPKFPTLLLSSSLPLFLSSSLPLFLSSSLALDLNLAYQANQD